MVGDGVIYCHGLESARVNGYWARIDVVADSLGHQVEGLQTVENAEAICATNSTVQVGDQVFFTCKATDPLARRITWEISYTSEGSIPGSNLGGRQSLSGDEVEFCWEVSEDHIGVPTRVQITMASASEDLRWPVGRDGCICFLYNIWAVF